MLSLLKATWWKVLCVLILMYVIIMGLAVPLGPGIQNITPESVNYVNLPTDPLSGWISVADDPQHYPAPLEVKVTGYNTHYIKGQSSLNIWLKSDQTGIAICPEKVEAKSEYEAVAYFDLNKYQDQLFDTTLFHLIVNNDLDGTSILRNGFAVYHPKTTQSLEHPKNTCDLVVNTNKSSFFTYPFRDILEETIRNLYFHVCMWFAMTLMLIFSVVYNMRYLAKGEIKDDIIASQTILTAMVFGIAGLSTGMVWARFTWGAFWTNDPRLTGVLIGMLIYLAYFILRGSFNDEIRRARVSSVYSIFAFVMFIAFIFIVPRMSKGSLHPGVGGNPAFSQYDLDNRMRMVFYPAVIGWTMLGFWVASLNIRYKILKNQADEMD